MRRVVFVILLALASLTAAPSRPARADDAADAKANEANRHFKLGVELYGEQKYSEALVEFQRAYEIFPHPSVLYNLAVTYRELSEYDQAIVYFERFLSEGPGKVDQARLDGAQKELDDLRARVGTITVTVKPDGAQITVDGKPVGKAPLARPLVRGPGEHVIAATGPGGQTDSKTVTIAAGDAASADLDVSAPVGHGEGGMGNGTPPTTLKVHVPPRARKLGVSAAMASNVLLASKTGAPVIGAALRFGSRVTAAVDVVLIAYAVVPTVRVRIAGDALSIEGIAAAPVNLTDGGSKSVFVSGAGGAGVRYRATDALAVHAQALVAAGSHGVTVPVFVGVELWF